MYDIIILGTGPAGYTAALYASRAFLKTLMISGPDLGGQLTTTTEVDNYPGFEHGISGPTLVEDMKKQVERFGTEVVLETVTKVDFSKRPFTIYAGEKQFQSKSVIIATGASAKYLEIPSEQKLRGKGISACATCDGFFFRGKEVVVIGGGDTAMEEATFLTKFATKVTIIHRREEFRASAIMLKQAQDNPKISFLFNKTVEEILGENAVTGVRLKDIKTGEISEITTQGFFLAIGHLPSTDFLKGAVELDQKGYIVIHRSSSSTEPQSRTSVGGVFAAGDCVDPRYKQAIVAAGMGCMAAIDASRWIEEVNIQ